MGFHYLLNSQEFNQNIFQSFNPEDCSFEKLRERLQCKNDIELLFIALKKKWISIVEKFLLTDIKINIQQIHGYSFLDLVVKLPDIKLVELLIDKIDNINELDEIGWSLLHTVCANFNPKTNLSLNNEIDYEIAKLLLDRGINANLQSSMKIFPIHISCEENNFKITKLLLDYRADVDAQDYEGKSALHIACYYNFLDIAKLLLDKKANVNIQNIRGITPLHLACEKYRIELIKLLLNYGADIDIKDNKGKTPVDYAREKDYIDVLRLLLKRQ